MWFSSSKFFLFRLYFLIKSHKNQDVFKLCTHLLLPPSTKGFQCEAKSVPAATTWGCRDGYCFFPYQTEAKVWKGLGHSQATHKNKIKFQSEVIFYSIVTIIEKIMSSPSAQTEKQHLRMAQCQQQLIYNMKTTIYDERWIFQSEHFQDTQHSTATSRLRAFLSLHIEQGDLISNKWINLRCPIQKGWTLFKTQKWGISGALRAGVSKSQLLAAVSIHIT